MPPIKRFRYLSSSLLYLFLAALLIKLSLFFYGSIYAPDSKYAYDTASYLRTGLNLVQQGVFAASVENDTIVYEIYRTPGYPLFLGILHDLLKLPLDFILLIQILLTLISAWIVYQTALLINKKIALLSSIIILFDQTITIFSLQLLSESLFLFMISLFMYSFVRYIKTKEMTWLVASSFCLIAATYVRPIGYYLGFVTGFVIICFSFDSKNPLKIIRPLFIFLVLTYSLLGLWQVRNYVQKGHLEFSSSKRLNLEWFGFFGSYEKDPEINRQEVTPLFYYVRLGVRGFLTVMTRPGSLKYYNSRSLKRIGNTIGYPWMVFYMIGFLVGLTQLRGSPELQFAFIILSYFLVTSVLGVGLITNARFRVPIMPFLALISSSGWFWLRSRFQLKTLST